MELAHHSTCLYCHWDAPWQVHTAPALRKAPLASSSNVVGNCIFTWMQCGSRSEGLDWINSEHPSK